MIGFMYAPVYGVIDPFNRVYIE